MSRGAEAGIYDGGARMQSTRRDGVGTDPYSHKRKKTDKYTRLLAVAGNNTEMAGGRGPTFVSFVFSDGGECVPKTIDVQIWLVGFKMIPLGLKPGF